MQSGEIIAVSLTGSSSFNVGMHSEFHELIWFKLGMTI